MCTLPPAALCTPKQLEALQAAADDVAFSAAAAVWGAAIVET